MPNKKYRVSFSPAEGISNYDSATFLLNNQTNYDEPTEKYQTKKVESVLNKLI